MNIKFASSFNIIKSVLQSREIIEDMTKFRVQIKLGLHHGKDIGLNIELKPSEH